MWELRFKGGDAPDLRLEVEAVFGAVRAKWPSDAARVLRACKSVRFVNKICRIRQDGSGHDWIPVSCGAREEFFGGPGFGLSIAPGLFEIIDEARDTAAIFFSLPAIRGFDAPFAEPFTAPQNFRWEPSPGDLRHVIAHEFGHALDFADRGINAMQDVPAADRIADDYARLWVFPPHEAHRLGWNRFREPPPGDAGGPQLGQARVAAP
jgi:hypothetical protein